MYHLCPVFSICKVNAEKGYESEMGSTSGDGGLHPGHMPAEIVTVSWMGQVTFQGLAKVHVLSLVFSTHHTSPPLPCRSGSAAGFARG